MISNMATQRVENERLPTKLGWSAKEDAITLEDILAVSEMIRNAVNLTSDAGESEGRGLGARDLHAGVRLDGERKRSGCPYGGSA